MMRKSRLFPIKFADSLKNEKKKNRNIGYMLFCFIYLKNIIFLKKLKVYGYIPSFPVVLIVQLYHKMAPAKNLHEQKKHFINQNLMKHKNKFNDYQNLRFNVAYVPFKLC